MRLNLFSFAIALLLTSCEGCNDDPKPKTELEKLPPASQSGKQTFGCLVDGKAWFTESYVDVPAFYQEGVLSIGASDGSTGIISINIFDENLSTKQYQLPEGNTSPFPPDEASLDEYKTSGCEFKTTLDHSGTVTISYLSHGEGNKWIISGTFEFEAYSADCDKVVKITDGRFDLNYAP